MTPEEGGALDYLQKALGEGGFRRPPQDIHRARHGAVENLYARIGTAAQSGVRRPYRRRAAGRRAAWTHPPFAGEIEDGAAVRPRRGRHEGRHRRVVAAALDHLGAQWRQAESRRLDLAADHRRRGKRRGQRHRQAAAMGGRARRKIRSLHPGRAKQCRRARRHHQDRPARLAQRHADRRPAARAMSPIPTAPTIRSVVSSR